MLLVYLMACLGLRSITEAKSPQVDIRNKIWLANNKQSCKWLAFFYVGQPLFLFARLRQSLSLL